MLSGVGPREHLRQLGIPLVADLPVGHNLQDHIYPGGIHFTINRPVSLTTRRIFTPSNMLKYFIKGRGKYSSALVYCLSHLHYIQ